jgi:hypothetical protein
LLTCYPQPEKARSMEVLAAFAAGAGGAPVLCGPKHLQDGAAAFYGVVGIEHLFDCARMRRWEWYYGDNSYFDAARGKYFRFTRNAFQVSAVPECVSFERLRTMKCAPLALGAWRKGGRHIVVVEQSSHFLKLSGAPNWLDETVKALTVATDRPLVLRRWSRDKAKMSDSLYKDLRGAHALVTHMSAAATEALLYGVPVFVTGECAAKPIASGLLSDIEFPQYPDGRLEWAANLANNQWTLEELRAGKYFVDTAVNKG